MSVAAVGVATSVAGVAATQPASISTSPVDLAALIVVGSSTNWDGAGVEDFFHGKFNDPIYTGPNGDDITYVNFFTGPLGIKAALEANAGEHNAVHRRGLGRRERRFAAGVAGSGFQRHRRRHGSATSRAPTAASAPAIRGSP